MQLFLGCIVFFGQLFRLPLSIFFAKAFSNAKKGFPLKSGCGFRIPKKTSQMI